MIPDRHLRPITLAFTAVTLALVGRMGQCLWLSITPVLVRDQWFMLDEILRLHQRKLLLNYLWTPYWGQRIVIPRLVFLLDDRLVHFSNFPLVCINVFAQALACAALIFLARQALRRESRWLLTLVAIAVVHLCFSSLQMENFVYGMAIQYTLGCVFAIAAFVLLGYSSGSRVRLTLAFSFALAATLTSAAGLIVWPVLIVESLWLRVSRATLLVFAAFFAVLAIAYSIGFKNVGTGMGIAGVFRHPLSAIGIASLVLGGPLSVFQPMAGQLAGLFGIAATIFSFVARCRRKVASSPPQAVLAAVCCFFAGIACSIVIGRMTPAFIASFRGIAPLPSRYFTFSFLFWAALLPGILATASARFPRLLFRAGTALIVAALSIGTASWQMQESLDWVSFTRQLEAASASFFVGDHDPQPTAIMFPDQDELDYWIPYLRDRHLSVFHEARAAWEGQPVSTLVQFARLETCGATLDAVNANGRVTGTIPAAFTARYGGTDIVFAGPDGRSIGTARTVFDSHQPFPPSAYPFSGYLRIPVPGAVTAWSLGRRICRF